ncbi:MAG: peptidoglycan DD-metalloendopeptidase family protein [Bacteroidota bacterium]
MDWYNFHHPFSRIITLLIRTCIVLGIIAVGSLEDAYTQALTKSQLMDKIAFTEKLLSTTREKQDRSLMDLNLVDKQLVLRTQLLRTLSNDIKEQDRQVQDLSRQIFGLENNLISVRDQYAETVKYAYKNFHADNFWLSLLSSTNLSEAYYRSLYFVEFSKYKAQQIQTIQEQQESLAQQKNEKLKSLEEKKKLQLQKELEIKSLERTQLEQERLIRILRKKEKTYVKRISSDRERLRELIAEIDTKYGEVPEFNEFKDIEKAFEREKGFHYWPVPTNKGVVVGEYGTTRDAFGNRIENDGVYIRTSKGQYIRSIFQGKVTGVTNIQMNGYVVIIEHGAYRSVYANLESYSVNPGDMIGAKQVIGTVRTEPRTNESLLHFLIYKAPDQFLDPEEWIFVD